MNIFQMFYTAFFTTQFLPPSPRDVANDAQHGIATPGKYTKPKDAD